MSGYNFNGLMVRQMFDRDSCTYTYLLVCTKTNDAILIDPVDIMVERDLECINRLGVKLVYGVNTHVHADHITGTGKLKQILPGCKSVLSKVSGGKADIFIEHGSKIIFGEQEIECRSTPGHTKGCMTYVSHTHKMIFCGDALLIGGCGRTDFQEGCAKTLYQSVHSQIFTLGDDYKIFPAHDYKGRTMSTVQEEKKFNPRLTKSAEEFVEIMNNLGLPYPKHIDRALPANLQCGITE